MGMSIDEYWTGHTWLVVTYKRKYRIERENANFDKYLQGMYFYEALVRVAPALHAFNTKPEPIPYLTEPYKLYSKENACDQDAKIDTETEQKQGNKKAVAFMQSFMVRHNAALAAKEKQEGSSATDN